MTFKRLIAVALTACLTIASAEAREPEGDDKDGVKLGRMSIVRSLVSEERLEKQAALQYNALEEKAEAQHALLPEANPIAARVRRIASELLLHTGKFNDRAQNWNWEINIINSPTVNAFCMPGGKIIVFTGIIDKLQMSDDEIALVVGHEIGHALREHSRARAAKGEITNVLAIGAAVLSGSNAVGQLASVSGDLLGRRFSRHDETEADLVGMELAARSGYDPRAGVHLWEKMSEIAKNEPPQWLSTHPSNASRVDTFKQNLKDVVGLYEKAKARKESGAQ